MKNIGISIFGQERDRGISKGKKISEKKRFGNFRPTFVFALQNQYPLHKLYILFQDSHEQEVDILKLDIEKTRNLQNKPSLPIEKRKLIFKNPKTDPYSHEKSCEQICKILQAIEKEYSGEFQIYLHTTTGTHTMQFAMYQIVDKQIIADNIHLVRTIKNEKKTENMKPFDNIIAIQEGIASKITLEFDTFLKKIQKNYRKQSTMGSLLLQSKNVKVQQHLENLIMVGKETDDILLIYGETGSGKSSIAREIHQRWQKGKQKLKAPFRAFNCASFTDNVAEMQLFGAKKGSYTGAENDTKGAFEAAEGGTLFLDEVAELDLRVQARILLAIEERIYYRFGDYENEKKVKCRLIFATNKSLEKLVVEKRFREDLLTRISLWTFTVPSLKERGDYESFLEHYLQEWNEKKLSLEKRAFVKFEREAKKKYIEFAKYANWKGNLRDLNSSINRMAMMTSLKNKPKIDIEEVEKEIKRHKTNTFHLDNEILQKVLLYAQKKQKNLSAMETLEEKMQEFLEAEGNSLAECGRILYQSLQKELTNPSSEFRQKKQKLLKKSKNC